MEKSTKNILLISGISLLVIGFIFFIVKKEKELKGEGEVSVKTKNNKIVFNKV